MRAARRDRPPRRASSEVLPQRLKPWLTAVLVGTGLLSIDSAYLLAVTLVGRATGTNHETWFYQWMFLAHLLLGIALVLPTAVFSAVHLKLAIGRRNRRAVRAGLALLGATVVLIVTGFALTRALVPLKDPTIRSVVYALHVAAPLAVAWLFVLHRLAGPRIDWRVGGRWLGISAVLAVCVAAFHSYAPSAQPPEPSADFDPGFVPALTTTVTGERLPVELMANDAYCAECHADVHAGWSASVHRFSSFNNPAYKASVIETRRVLRERDGHTVGARFCAGCHDPVLLLSGVFDDPRLDDPESDLVNGRAAQAGITCTVCHSAVRAGGGDTGYVLGNGDYVIRAPVHYPFAFSESAALRWVNRQLVKAKPAFHRSTFLDEGVHRSSRLCGSCHKVHIPPELTDYKWLRGQNHHDSFWLSGVSGHGVASFYHPPKAADRCADCHMPLAASEDFGARRFAEDGPLAGELAVHDHLFPGANTAIPALVGKPEAIERHRAFLEGALRVDLFGLRRGDDVEAPLEAPLAHGEIQPLDPGGRYLLEVVLRTLTVGHVFTQGTADSNQVWLEATARVGERIIGRSGAMDPATGIVDPGAHFVNAYVIDREGRRIDRRNVQDIFVALYDHQIPPGAADVVHLGLDIPEDARGTVTVEVALRYRKFDTTYLRFFTGEPDAVNELPVVTIASDSVSFPIATQGHRDRLWVDPSPSPPPWQRWNDYGIGLLRKGAGKAQARQAEQAFREVERQGHPEGPLNLARVYLAEGRVEEAAAALERATAFTDPPPRPWTVLWLGAQVASANGDHVGAYRDLEQIHAGGFAEALGRGFDFSLDWNLLNAMGTAAVQVAVAGGGDEGPAAWLARAEEHYRATLDLDPENLGAHWGLALVHGLLGEREDRARELALHHRYKPDDNARDRAVAAARRRDPHANRAAEAVVVYPLAP